MMKKWTIAAAALVCALSLAFLLGRRACDVRDDVGRLESEVLDVLSSRGMADGDAVSREEEFWSKGVIKGKTVSYTFSAGKDFFSKGLDKDLRKAAASVRGVRLADAVFKPGKGGAGAEKYDFFIGRDVVLSVSVKNAVPGAPRKAPAAARSEGMRAAAPADVKPMVAVVLDDFGYTKKNFADLKAAGIPVTMAILPNAPYTKAASDFARANGMEVVLHLPMEPKDARVKLEKDTVKVSMGPLEVSGIIERDMRQLPYAKGVSNHMGSKATGDAGVMRAVIGDMGKRKMYFLDSMTTDEPVSGEIAAELGVPSVCRDIFIDHVNDEAHIKVQMEKLISMALKGSDVVAIGHDRTMTVRVLKEYVPRIKKSGIRFVLLSEIVAGRKD